MKHEELWRKIKDFALDNPDAEAPFSARLAQMMGWTEEYTERAVLEYRRFLYLTMITEEPQVPPADVDTVWHWHLQYTENYWLALCKKTLGKAIHHIPSDGSAFHKERYEELYGKTLQSYESAFGAPPNDIWPYPACGIETGSSKVDEDIAFLTQAA